MTEVWKAVPEKNPVKLWERAPGFDASIGQDEPTVTPYLLKGKGNGCVIVFPGGGYGMKAVHEAEPVALAMNRLGFSAFVLDYRVCPYRFPLPQRDAARAVRHVRFHAESYGVDPGRIAVLGFSAGGHLAASAGVFWDKGHPESSDPVERVSSRPDAAVLCYPVILLYGKLRHEGSARNLLGARAGDGALRRALTPSLHAAPDSSPAFLWHTADDEAVPAGNSVEMFGALRAQGVTAELHIFPHGAHGLGLAEGDPQVSKWPELCGAFLGSLGF
jgi:acetyl esterase/lipase